jgi:hypothetical protein
VAGWAQSENVEQQGAVLGVGRCRSHHQRRSMFLVRTQWEGILDALAGPRSTGHRAPPGCAGPWLDRCPPGRSIEALRRQSGRDDYHRREERQAGATRDPHLRTERGVRSGPVEVNPTTVMAASSWASTTGWAAAGDRGGIGEEDRGDAPPACPAPHRVAVIIRGLSTRGGAADDYSAVAGHRSVTAFARCAHRWKAATAVGRGREDPGRLLPAGRSRLS